MSQNLAEFARGQIRAEMARQELTTTQLAARLGVSDMWVSRRLRGVTDLELTELERIADALSLPVGIFLERAS